ncbi:MAG: DUF5009 domain-containing protein [Kiritimatiellae bacterium]|nr:DUF5009 domain-containing protein [Kiritimatiellia bacterium]
MEVKKERLMSLDALRGADMLFIMGFSGVIFSLCAWLGMKDCWLATQMTHVDWHGFRHHDTIFPLFLFLAGVSWPFSYAGQIARGRSTAAVLRKIGLRALTLIFFGVATSEQFWRFNFASVRYDTVLAHIGVCWAAAALLYVFVKSWKVRLAIAAALLVGHWALLFFIPAPDAAAVLSSADPAVAKVVAKYASDGTGNFSPVGCLACWIDRSFGIGRINEVIFNADGLLAKITGAALAILGTLAGEVLRDRNSTGNRKTCILLGAGALALVLAIAWRPWCPVNKKIWTATFALASAAYSFFNLAAFYWIVDVRGWRHWTFFFSVIGMNSITIYMLMRIVGFNRISRLFFSGVAGWGNPDWNAAVILLGEVVVEWLVLWFLYRKKAFLKV